MPASPPRDEEDLRIREEEEGAAAVRQRLPALPRRCLRAPAEGPGQAAPRGRQRRPGPGAAGTEEVRHRRAGQGGAVSGGEQRRPGAEARWGIAAAPGAPGRSCSPGSSAVLGANGRVAARSGRAGSAAELSARLGVGTRLVLPETLEFGLASNCRLTLFARLPQCPHSRSRISLPGGAGVEGSWQQPDKGGLQEEPHGRSPATL